MTTHTSSTFGLLIALTCLRAICGAIAYATTPRRSTMAGHSDVSSEKERDTVPFV